MWLRTEQCEMINLNHSHNIHVVEHSAPKFQIEIVAAIGGERHILAHMPKIGAEGRQMAVEYVDRLCLALSQSGQLYAVPMYPRHAEMQCRK